MPRANSPRSINTMLVNRVRRFGREEDGSLIIFALVLFTLMMMMGGFAMDLMKGETVRTQLANTLDRCTLMAASLDQRLDPQSVVEDCVAKAGLRNQLQSVRVTQGLNSRNVVAVGKADTKPMFMHLIGIDDYVVNGRSAAVQSVTNVEIALVLDVSGSMSGAKITNLRAAASEFVATMLSNDPEHRISITIVPYNAQVNLGAALRSQYNTTHVHNVANVNCLELPPAAFASATLSRADALPMMAYADHYYGTNKTNSLVSPIDASYALPNYASEFCRKNTVNTVRLPQQDVATLQSQINALQAGGNTSITLGMKWGLTLLDPGARPMFSNLIAQGQMAANLAGRPFDYTDGEAMKVIVLMTDGEHVAHNRIIDTNKSGPSPIYKSADGRYSVFHASHVGDKYFVPHLGAWQATVWNAGVQQNWQDIWANLKLSYIAWQFYARALGTDSATRNTIYNNTFNGMQATYADVSTMNTQLQQSCGLAKANDVIVYGIAFEAPTNGQAQISQCASSPAHYFNAQGMEIQTAFRSIASNLSQLKLTQ